MIRILSVLFLTVFSGALLGYTPTPQILSDEDKTTYQNAFYLKKSSGTNSVSDPLLKGVFLSELYLSKTYRAKGTELRDWLNQYSDLPNAPRIYKLAKKKNVKSLKSPSYPKRTYRVHSATSRFTTMIRNNYRHHSGANQKYLKKKIKNFKRAIYRGHSKNAKDILNDPKFKKLIRSTDYNRMCGKLAFMYFLDGMYSRTKKWADKASETAANASWVMGLTAFIQEDYEMASHYFERVKTATQEIQWMQAQGAYWAYRANDANGNSSKAEEMLEFAAKITDSFYGILAGKKLNVERSVNWVPFRMTVEDAQEILSWKGGMRALALIQLGYLDLAEAELKYLLKFDQSPALIQAVLALAGQENLPHFSLDVARTFIGNGSDLYASAAYPVPDWTPSQGWQIDKALVYGVIRQESRFKPKAKSYVGASGLMQLMPATASFVERDRSLRRKNKSRLQNPEYNLSVGQKYIQFITRLLGERKDLIRLLSSYNAGPKTVLDFDKKIEKHGEDPLLYLECFPAKETRSYVKNVLMNIWMYQLRFNEDSTSLDQLSKNDWPLY